MNKQRQQALALAGVAQAAFMVHQLSQSGMAAQDKLDTAINSLFVTNPKTTEEVYGKVSKLNLGLQVLQEIFQGGTGSLKKPDVMRYIFALFYLEGKLSNNKTKLNELGAGLEKIQLPDGTISTPEVIEQLAEIYQTTLSTLSFRIQVKGNMTYLQKPETANKVRAILLSGIRSAVLWRQLGGKRWHFLFYKKRIARDVTLLLSNIA